MGSVQLTNAPNDATQRTAVNGMAGKLFSWPALFSSADEQAMWRVREDGDPAAFAQLMARWQEPIRGVCARMTGDAHRGEDLAQDAFARLFAKRQMYEPTAKFSTFLWRIALNLCYDELRKQKRRGEFSLDAHTADLGDDGGLASDEAGPDTRLAESERAEAVRRALLELSEPYRVVVVLRHYEGLKFREIGDVLGIPEGTVKSRMFEALTQLDTLLRPVVTGEVRPTARKESLLV